MSLQQLEQEYMSLKMSINSRQGMERSYGYEQQIYERLFYIKMEIKEEKFKLKREKKLKRILNEQMGTN